MSKTEKKINAKKGDMILTANYPLAYEVFKNLGCYWGHCGMVMDDNGTSIRHCNFHIEKVNIIWHNILGFKIFPKMLDPESLSNGIPGFITQTIDDAFFSKRPDFFIENGVILQPKPEKEEEYRPHLHKIADKMANMNGYYRLNSFMEINQLDDSNQRVKNRGTICTGAVYIAHKLCGKELNLVKASADEVKQASENLRKYLWDFYQQKLGILGVSILKITDLGKKMANQIINTYMADRTSDTTDWWRRNIKSTKNLAPDHFLPKGMENPEGHSVGVQDEKSSYYGEIVPIKISEMETK